jgi:phenylpropionate dioxygenase-like ring-hydroxylating dioxygenase large terminal subunit
MFLSHVSDLKNNSWRVYPQLPNWTLTKQGAEHSLVSNVCLHQGSRLRGEFGQGDRTCPFHGWKYSIDGQPLASGNTAACVNAGPLSKQSVTVNNNFIFNDQVVLPKIDFINTDHLELVENRIDVVHTHWQHIINLFLDVDHIPVVHPGVYQEISAPNVNDLEWYYSDNSSVQLVPRIEVNNEFNSTLLPEDRAGKYSAAWTTVYPYSMLEWQPGAWFITVCIPVDAHTTKVNVYKYRDCRYSDKNWEINERVWELAWKQDREQAEQLTTLNIPRGNLEAQKLHFLDWLDRCKQPF